MKFICLLLAPTPFSPQCHLSSTGVSNYVAHLLLSMMSSHQMSLCDNAGKITGVVRARLNSKVSGGQSGKQQRRSRKYKKVNEQHQKTLNISGHRRKRVTALQGIGIPGSFATYQLDLNGSHRPEVEKLQFFCPVQMQRTQHHII